MTATAIIIPTYHEAENIAQLVPAIHKHMQGFDYCTIIVDDNSQDGTEYWYDCNQSMYPVQLLIRKKERGLASAILAGMRYWPAKSYIVMDADFSHPPEILPTISQKLLDYDLVVASRYVRDGGMDGWPLRRQLISRGANLLAYPLSPVRDLTSGFFGIRSQCLAGSNIEGIGYKIGLECFVKAHWETCIEIPYTFRDRHAGESKLNGRVMQDYLKHLIRLYRWKYLETKQHKPEKIIIDAPDADE